MQVPIRDCVRVLVGGSFSSVPEQAHWRVRGLHGVISRALCCRSDVNPNSRTHRKTAGTPPPPPLAIGRVRHFHWSGNVGTWSLRCKLSPSAFAERKEGLR